MTMLIQAEQFTGFNCTLQVKLISFLRHRTGEIGRVGWDAIHLHL